MLEQMFAGLFDTVSTTVISINHFLLCIVASLLIGSVIALTYTYKGRYTKSFVVTLATLPCVVCMVIMMVNGNLGAGVAVAGAFSLVRFRSVAGSAKEISAIFLAMGAGLAAGMGYLGYSALFTVILCAVNTLYVSTHFGEMVQGNLDKTLRITIPEDLDYTGVFDDLLQDYTTAFEVTSVKTTNMGSLFKLTYNLTLKDGLAEKEFIDKLRCRNGNLEITVSKQESSSFDRL